MVRSTRSSYQTTCSAAILSGLSSDGGLFVPQKIPDLKLNQSWLNLSYRQLAVEVLSHYLVEFTLREIETIVDSSYSEEAFPYGETRMDDYPGFSLLRLDQGPTLAFKDMALVMLPHLVQAAKQKEGIAKRIVFLTATSGDTGGAAMAGFRSYEDGYLIVLYPTHGISDIQRRQMHQLETANLRLIPVDGNFDDCQRLVKQAFQEIKIPNTELSSTNSMNIGRLLPQIVYYVHAYLQVVKSGSIAFGDQLDVYVPTGNFGNILAAYYAKKMGVPFGKLIGATNQNDVVHQFIQSGVYDIRRPFTPSLSPAMDILVSSNLERLLFDLYDGSVQDISTLMEQLQAKKVYQVSSHVLTRIRETFDSAMVNESATIAAIRRFYAQFHRLIDPHTAVAYGAYLHKQDSSRHALVVSTASPFKFPEAMFQAFGLSRQVPLDVQYHQLESLDPTCADPRAKELYQPQEESKGIMPDRVLAMIREMAGEWS